MLAILRKGILPMGPLRDEPSPVNMINKITQLSNCRCCPWEGRNSWPIILQAVAFSVERNWRQNPSWLGDLGTRQQPPNLGWLPIIMVSSVKLQDIQVDKKEDGRALWSCGSFVMERTETTWRQSFYDQIPEPSYLHRNDSRGECDAIEQNLWLFLCERRHWYHANIQCVFTASRNCAMAWHSRYRLTAIVFRKSLDATSARDAVRL